MHQLNLDGNAAERIVLGDWYEQRQRAYLATTFCGPVSCCLWPSLFKIPIEYQ